MNKRYFVVLFTALLSCCIALSMSEQEARAKLDRVNKVLCCGESEHPSTDISCWVNAFDKTQKMLTQGKDLTDQMLMECTEAISSLSWYVDVIAGNVDIAVEVDKGEYENPIEEYNTMQHVFNKFKKTDWTELVKYLDTKKESSLFHEAGFWKENTEIIGQYNSTFDPNSREKLCKQLQLDPKTFKQINPRSLFARYRQLKKRGALKTQVALLYPDPESAGRKALESALRFSDKAESQIIKVYYHGIEQLVKRPFDNSRE